MIDETPKSVRFNPSWEQYAGEPVAGLIQLIFDIYRIDNNASKWVEVGTYIGESALIISSFDFVKTLYCVDPYIKRHKDILYTRLRKPINQKKLFFLHQLSIEAALSFDDNSLDVVYIDACHDYDSVKQDISIWYNKVKDGGFLCGHDYSDTFPGSKQAINEFIQKHQYTIKNYVDSSWMIRKSTTYNI